MRVTEVRAAVYGEDVCDAVRGLTRVLFYRTLGM